MDAEGSWEIQRLKPIELSGFMSSLKVRRTNMRVFVAIVRSASFRGEQVCAN